MTQKYQVKVSMKQAAIVETGIVLKQGDFGMQIEIEVLDFDATGTTPQIVFRKAMGAVESTTITVSSNKYTYTFKGTELDTPGKVFCDLKLKNSTTQRISTASFMFKVVADTLDGLEQKASSYSDTIEKTLEGYEAELNSFKSTLAVRTKNLITDNWILKNCEVERNAGEIKVSATNASNGQYAYQIIDVRNIDYIAISTGAMSGTGVPLIRLGSANAIDSTSWTWTYSFSTQNEANYSMANTDYLVVALYAISWNGASGNIGDYSIYSNTIISAGNTKEDYTPPSTAADFDARNEINKINSKISSLASLSYNLVNEHNWKTYNANVELEIKDDEIKVKLVNQAGTYKYAFQVIDVRAYEKITISGIFSGTGQAQVRVGSAASLDATTCTWISNYSSLPQTIDVSSVSYLLIGLYAAYNTQQSAGAYITYKYINVCEGTNVLAYIPNPVAKDALARREIERKTPKYRCLAIEKGSIDSWGNNVAYDSSDPRVRTKEYVYLFKGDTFFPMLPNMEFAYRYYSEGKTFTVASGWLTKKFVVENEGYYRFIARRTTTPKDIGFDDIEKNYEPFMLIWNNKGKALYQYKDAEAAITKTFIHRGMSLLAPENTLPAFRMARDYGFTLIETDIWFSQDGTPFICHDETVDRTSNGTGKIADLTDDELKALDFGSWFGAEWTGTQIPTLEEALIDSRKYGYKLQIEPKESWTVDNRAETIVNLIEKYNMEKDVIIAGFDGYTLTAVHQLNEYIDLGRAYTEITELNVNVAQYLQGDHNRAFIMIFPITGITSENIHFAIDAHMEVAASITNTIPEIENLIELGVSRILSDSININDFYNHKNI